MIEVVINYNTEKGMYGAYEPSTNTCMLSANITEAIAYLEKFLQEAKLLEGSLMESNNIYYHLDSATMHAIAENNIALMKRLSTAPSGFMMSEKKMAVQPKEKRKPGSGMFSKSGFGNSYKKFGNA